VNRVLGEERQTVLAIREDDDRGRHTTTSRRLFCCRRAGCWSTRGMREVGMWGDESGIDLAFEDVAALAAACRFRDCRHETEPGCGVLTAVEDGSLAPERLDAYRKLLRELAFHARKNDPAAQAEQRRVWKQRAKANWKRDHGR